ncbi:MAG: hypothetical protein AAFP19_04765 [Bacteroidota bacterium]
MKKLPTFHQTFELLFQSEEEEVVYCYECQLFHVHYGTVSLDLSESDLKIMIQKLRYYLSMYQGIVAPHQRCIEVDTPYMGIRLLLSPFDLATFSSILETAKASHETLKRQRKLN